MCLGISTVLLLRGCSHQCLWDTSGGGIESSTQHMFTSLLHYLALKHYFYEALFFIHFSKGVLHFWRVTHQLCSELIPSSGLGTTWDDVA